MKRLIVSTALALGLGCGAAAQEAPALAEVGLQTRIEALEGPEHAFERGMLMALRAVEKTVQARYDYGLGARLNGLPMLRLEVGQRNPAPKPATPDTLARIMRTALADLEAARAVLGQVQGAQITPFELTLQDVWFDANSNGTPDPGENVAEGAVPLLLGRGALRRLRDEQVLSTPLTVRFDEADHAWLTAYTHMLSGVAHLFVAFDPSPVIRNLEEQRAALSAIPTLENTFDPVQVRAEIDALKAERQQIEGALAPVQARERLLREKVTELRSKEPRDDAAITELNGQINALRAEDIGPLRRQKVLIDGEIRAALNKLEGGRDSMVQAFRTDVDAIYLLLAALRQQPDADHIAAAHDHWRAMIAQNRVFWEKIGQETDNDREWIPNPSQISALGLTVDADLARGWQAILRDAEDVLEGRLLLPHPLLEAGLGINLRAYAENPGPIDLLDWAHGIGAYPYLARGPVTTRQRWLALRRLTGGNAGGFALFFN